MIRKKIAIIGASYLQVPLILKAKEMNLETHVFAWQVGDEGETIADFFYPISIVEKEIGIDGICTIASDLAVITVNYIAEKMKLIGNTMYSTMISTDKNAMRRAFERNGDPSPKSIQVYDISEFADYESDFLFPVIVKPVDRSGSRGVVLVDDKNALSNAIELAKSYSFKKAVVIEEYVEGEEYSVECISWNGKHTLLSITKKYTTGAPNFIETAHLEPAPISIDCEKLICEKVFHALDSLEIKNGASHSELKITNTDEIKFIEIGGRMGGDNIGSSLVPLSTGYDFVKNVILVSLGIEPDVFEHKTKNCVAIKYILSKSDMQQYEKLKEDNKQLIVETNIEKVTDRIIIDSASRFGCYTIMAQNDEDIYTIERVLVNKY